MEHSFNIEIARLYGVNAAILLNNIYFWTEHNRANEKHYHDGRYWTYSSVKAFETLFPYMTTKQIRYALDKLAESRIILRGHFYEDQDERFDRTCWYAITEHGYKLLSVAQDGGSSHLPILANVDLPILERPFADNGKSSYITDINFTDINHIDTLTTVEMDACACAREVTAEAVEAEEQTCGQIADQSAHANARYDTVVLGAYNNVELTVAEYYNLLEVYGMARINGKIERLSDYLHRHPDRARMRYYTDHGKVLDGWLKEDEKGREIT